MDVWDSTGGNVRRLVTHATSIEDFVWNPNGHEIAFLAANPSEPSQELTENRKPPIVIGEHVALRRLWVVDLPTGEVRRMPTAAEHVTEVAYSPDGRLLAYLAQPAPEFPQHYRELYVVPGAGGASRRLTNNQHDESNLAWRPDGTELAYVAATEDNPLSVGPPRLQVVAVTGGTPRVLTPDFDGYVSGPVWSNDGHSLMFTAGVGVTQHLYQIASTGRRIESITTGEGVFYGLTLDRLKRAAASRTRDAGPLSRHLDNDACWHANAGGHRTQSCHVSMVAGQSETVRWKSTDGVEIEGLVVYPVDYVGGTPLSHGPVRDGGPEGATMRRFSEGWGNPAQIYAAAGFVTLMPNFRGSSNYGGRFALGAGGSSIAPEEGSFVDCMTGLDALIEKGVADPDPLAIRGWSYGGYFTSWAIGHTTRFKAAVEGAGDTDLISYYGTAVINPGFDILNEHPYDNPEKWHKRSPLTYVSA